MCVGPYCWTGAVRRARSIGLVETLRGYGQVSHGRSVCFHLGTICQWYTSSKSCDKGSRNHVTVTAPFLLVNPDFSKTEVVKAYAHTIVAPVIDYWKRTIEGKKGDQLERMKAVRIFNPLHVLGNKMSESDIDGLKIFKFYEYPEIRAQIEVM